MAYLVQLASLTQIPLELSALYSYWYGVPRDYGYKRACNKRIGPGGGTRRLHHQALNWDGSFGRYGDEIGSTNV